MAGTKRKRFQLSSLPSDERELLAGYIKKLGGTLLEARTFSRQATHVICGKANRGEKYLGGCALGKWVLQKEFVEDSYKQGSWVKEEQYEWTSSMLAAGAEKELLALHNAPRKWRMAFQNSKAGAYRSWNAIVYMQDAKMTKAYERLLEAGDATVCKKKISFRDPCNLPKDLTHIFVETKLKPDVLHLASQGISICSPDRIPEHVIEGPKETFATSNTLMKYNNLVNKHIPKIPAKAKEKPGVLPGKENETAVELKSKDVVVARRGVKRSTSDCELCVIKRQKTTAQNNLLPFVQISSTKNPPTARHLTFPVYVSNILESCFDEECLDLGMQSVASCLSTTQAPTSKWLHIIIDQFLLKASTQQQAFQSYRLLQNIIEVHPPAVNKKLYLNALVEPVVENSQNLNNNKSTPWEFVSKVIRISLSENNSCEETKRMQRNADLLLNVFDNLFKRDGCSTEKHSSIIVGILWQTASGSACQSNSEMKEFVVLCCEAAKLAVSDDSRLFVCHVLLDWLSMAVALRSRDDATGEQACESLALQLLMEISGTNCYEATKLLLQGCHSSWLKMRILELILDNYDKRLIPEPYKCHLNKTLKLNKIVHCYFFLLPNIKTSGKTNVEKRTKTTTKRKNRKGEGPLHVACIQNDAAKVEEILKLKNLDVNESDNAGWTALHEACNRGHLQCVKKILQHHEKTNCVNLLACPDDGVTVLHDAVLNNHLPVVKLLAQAGGSDLLQAKTSSGMTALQLSRSNEMSSFIASELDKRQRNSDQIHGDTLRPLPETYGKVLSRNRRKNYIPFAECEKYLFYVSQLLQIYLKENNVVESTDVTGNSAEFCPKCKADANDVKNISQHLQNLEDHVMSLCGKRNLSQICQLYMTSMRLCL